MRRYKEYNSSALIEGRGPLCGISIKDCSFINIAHAVLPAGKTWKTTIMAIVPDALWCSICWVPSARPYPTKRGLSQVQWAIVPRKMGWRKKKSPVRKKKITEDSRKWGHHTASRQERKTENSAHKTSSVWKKLWCAVPDSRWYDDRSSGCWTRFFVGQV